MSVPSQARNFYWFTVVRNPYAREWSCYCRRRKPGKPSPIRRATQLLTWPEYVEAHTSDPEGWRDVSQTEFIRRVKPDAILHFEDLLADLLTLPFWPSDSRLPVSNQGVPGDHREQYTPDIAGKIAAWAKEDFEQFGYDLSSWQLPMELT